MLVLKKENHITGDDIFGVNGLVWGHDGLIMDFFGELMEQGEDKVKKKKSSRPVYQKYVQTKPNPLMVFRKKK